jgi:hypothetical protein
MTDNLINPLSHSEIYISIDISLNLQIRSADRRRGMARRAPNTTENIQKFDRFTRQPRARQAVPLRDFGILSLAVEPIGFPIFWII